MPAPASLLAVGAVVGVGVAACSVLLLHLLPTGYRPLSDAVSDYGVGRYRRLYQLQVVASGLGALLLAGGLGVAGIEGGVGLVCLVAYGLARVGIARFPTDLEPPLTPTGRTHALLAAIAFGTIAVGAPLIGGAAAARWSGLQPGILTLSAVVLVTAVLTFASGGLPALRRKFGAIERTFYLAAFAWLLVLALLLATG